LLKDEGREIEASIRKTTSTGRLLGSERFIKILERDILPKKAGRPKKKSQKICEVSLNYGNLYIPMPASDLHFNLLDLPPNEYQD